MITQDANPEIDEYVAKAEASARADGAKALKVKNGAVEWTGKQGWNAHHLKYAGTVTPEEEAYARAKLRARGWTVDGKAQDAGNSELDRIKRELAKVESALEGLKHTQPQGIEQRGLKLRARREHLLHELKLLQGTTDAQDAQTPEEWEEAVTDRIYTEQANEITKTHGAKAASSANYGWGVSSDDKYVSVATKVYGHGVLTSEATFPSMSVRHRWR